MRVVIAPDLPRDAARGFRAQNLRENLRSSATFAGFTGQGSPIPVFDFAVGPSTVLTFQTLKGICVFTEESLTASNVESVVRQVLGENLGLSLDALMLSASAGGLLNGVVAGSESANADLNAAMFEDLTTLLSAVAPVAAGSGRLSIAEAAITLSKKCNAP